MEEFREKNSYPLMRNLKADLRNAGLEPQLIPFADHTSSQRLNMFTTGITQAMIPDGRELPLVASGKEYDFMRYTFNATRLDQNARTVAVIPLYRTNVGSDPIKYCPMYILVYYGEQDELMHSMYVYSYTQGTNGFGYDLEINKSYFVPGAFIPKGTCISHSKAVVDNRYCLGTNLNICYGTFKETVEDAFAISESAAKKLETTGYSTLLIRVGKNMVPLNLYGSIDEYKFLPELGDKIREDGIVCGFRTVDETTYMTDLTDLALMKPQHEHDTIYYLPKPDATLINIKIDKNPNKKVKTPEYMFEQSAKYETEQIEYYKRIIKVYEEECVKKGIKPSLEFISLVDNAAKYLGTVPGMKVFGKTRKTPSKLSRKNEPIGFIDYTLTFRYKIPVSLGSKLTGRSGDKGVISKIIPDKYMVVDDYGNKADILMAPETVPNRMNVSQMYEVFLNFVSGFVIRKMKQVHVDKAYSILIDYFNDVNPEYAKMVNERVCLTQGDKEQLVHDAITKGIVLIVPPFLNTITTEWVLKLKNKWGVKPTPITYYVTDSDNNVIRKVRTRKAFMIAQKYVYILCKIPYVTSSGLGYVNQWGVPIAVRDQISKSMYPVALTAIREGEDETRCLIMSMSSRLAYRILAIHANSPYITQKCADELLSNPHPSQIEWFNVTDEQLRSNNQMSKAWTSMMTTCGIDIRDSIATDEEIEKFTEKEEEAFEEELTEEALDE